MIHVQFLPRLRNESLEPLIGILGERLVDRFRDHGINWGCRPAEADLVWGSQHRYETRRDLPMVVQDVVDWASLNWTGRSSIQQSHVRLVVKGTLFKDQSHYNEAVPQNTYHSRRVYDSAPLSERPVGKAPEPVTGVLADQHFGKLRLGYNWLYHPRLDSLAGMNRAESARDVDVFFAGTTKYSAWHVQWHRERVVEVLKSLPGNVIVSSNRGYKPRDYDEMVCRSKVVVSPWGFGETCIRDVEAIVAGCVLVKPDTCFIRTWPEYHNVDHCLAFKPDASDLAVTVKRAVAGFDELSESRQQTQAEFKRLRSPEVLADRVAGLVREALQV